jgi:fibronectin type 3 domain-containing protein
LVTETVEKLTLATPKVKIYNSSNGIKVKWNEIDNALSYSVFRSEEKSDGKWTGWKKVSSVKYGKTSVTDKTVKEGTHYRYTVKAVVNGVFTSYNPDGPYTMRLSTPTLKSAIRLDEGVKVTWNGVKGAQGYQVYRKTADTTWVLIDTVDGTDYMDDTALPGVEYTYTVRAYSSSYKSAYNTKGLTVKDKY